MNQPSDPGSPLDGDNTESIPPSEGPSDPQHEGGAPPSTTQSGSVVTRPRPSITFLAIVSIVSLGLDLGTKWWALHTLEKPLPNGDGIPAPMELTSWLTLLLARNRGGAWGLLQTANEEIRKPFFLIISIVAIGFIVYLYRKIHPKQHALKWGLPLVLGGAVGNLIDRVRYGWVIDFIDYRSVWVRWLNEQIARIWPTHAVTDHWPTFNIADVAICVGVGLMAIDMFTSRKVAQQIERERADAKAEAEPPASVDDAPDSADSPASSEADPPPEQSKV